MLTTIVLYTVGILGVSSCHFLPILSAFVSSVFSYDLFGFIGQTWNSKKLNPVLWVKAESSDSILKHDHAKAKTMPYFKSILSHIMHQIEQMMNSSLQTYACLTDTTLAFAEGVGALH